jgi:hypothetical protein
MFDDPKHFFLIAGSKALSDMAPKASAKGGKEESSDGDDDTGEERLPYC